MTLSFKKAIAVSLAALTLSATTIAPAFARGGFHGGYGYRGGGYHGGYGGYRGYGRRNFGPGLAAGVIGGLAFGALAAGAYGYGNGYYGGGYGYSGCYLQRRAVYGYYGEYAGTRLVRVCD